MFYKACCLFFELSITLRKWKHPFVPQDIAMYILRRGPLVGTNVLSRSQSSWWGPCNINIGINQFNDPLKKTKEYAKFSGKIVEISIKDTSEISYINYSRIVYLWEASFYPLIFLVLPWLYDEILNSSELLTGDSEMIFDSIFGSAKISIRRNGYLKTPKIILNAKNSTDL